MPHIVQLLLQLARSRMEFNEGGLESDRRCQMMAMAMAITDLPTVTQRVGDPG